MQQDILIHTINVHRQGEKQYFQIRIPNDAPAITGIATGIQLIATSTDIPATGQMGVLQLQTTGQYNHCYNSIVRLSPAAARKLDLGFTDFQAGYPHPSMLLQDGLAQRSHDGPEAILLPGRHIFYGNYTDYIGRRLAMNIIYTVVLTFWTTPNRHYDNSTGT